jgi:hypothetical protein
MGAEREIFADQAVSLRPQIPVSGTDLFPGFLPGLQTFALHIAHLFPSNLKLFPFLPPKKEIPPIPQTT